MPRISIRPTEEKVLFALWRYHLLTAEQIRKLFFGKGKYVWRVLHTLKEAGLVSDALFLNRSARMGRSATAYQLTVAGMKYIRSDPFTIDVRSRIKSGAHRIVSYSHLAHLLTLNDFLINVELLARATATLRVVNQAHDLDLKQDQFKVGNAQGKPDAVVELELGSAHEVWWVEIDRGDLYEDPSRWRQKVSLMVKWGERVFKGRYGEQTALSFVVVAAPEQHQEQRLEALVHWTELELLESKQLAWAAPFFLTGGLPAALFPIELFCANRWYQPEPDKRQGLHPNQRLPFSSRTAVPLLSDAELRDVA